ncbi:hypothetical protein M413DRAFT_442407 [Hebeloma cylindrosporum]|uniref:Secreted protein n=1 Tax=Hebeloma cylindrosporum TaxID=76867 RepID=A0A0C3CK01_HEBCY|nr:hypothetical protein M413DRAFT_442407 [Hebeloma cylindrosporum h7]
MQCLWLSVISLIHSHRVIGSPADARYPHVPGRAAGGKYIGTLWSLSNNFENKYISRRNSKPDWSFITDRRLCQEQNNEGLMRQWQDQLSTPHME